MGKKAAASRASALVVGMLTVLGALFAAAPAVAAPAADVVQSDDVSALNASGGTTGWDLTAQSGACPALPSAATSGPWVLDYENKPLGDYAVDDDGLTLSVVQSYEGDTTGTKVRLQHYLAQGGYGLPASATLTDLFAQPIGWTQTVLTQDPDNAIYSPTFQIKLQKEAGGVCDRLTIFSEWAKDSGTYDFGAARWIPGSHATRAGSSASAMDRAALLASFGDYQVVSFGPNLGRDGFTYSYAIQDLQAFGVDFRFWGDTIAAGDPVPGSEPPAPPALPTTDQPEPEPSATNAAGDPLVPPTVAPSEEPPAPGDSIQVTYPAATFEPFEWVQFVFYSVPQYATQVQADASGGLAAAVPVPTTLAAGSHVLAATGTTSGVVATAAVSIAAAPGLAATGVDSAEVWELGTIAAAILLLGLVAVVAAAARRRSARG